MRFQASGSFLVAGLLPLVAASAGAQRWDLAALRAFTTLTPDQWNAVNRGIVQAEILRTQTPGEVAVIGVARVRASTACFLTRFRDIEKFKKSPDVLNIEKFEPPLEPRVLAGFRLQPGDVQDLPQCGVGSCNVKLSAETIQRLANYVDWSRPDHDTRAQAIFREAMLNYLQTYLREGNPALIVYRDKSKPVSLANEFRGVLDARPGLADLVPRFRDYLAEYPGGSLPGVSDFFYWSTEKFGFKAVDSITHVFIYTQPGQAVVASKQLYASHYFAASLGFTAALDDRSDPSHPAMYLVYLNRSRVDLLAGFLGGLRRAILRGRLEDGMRDNLAEVARKLAASCTDQPNGE